MVEYVCECECVNFLRSRPHHSKAHHTTSQHSTAHHTTPQHAAPHHSTPHLLLRHRLQRKRRRPQRVLRHTAQKVCLVLPRICSGAQEDATTTTTTTAAADAAAAHCVCRRGCECSVVTRCEHVALQRVACVRRQCAELDNAVTLLTKRCCQETARAGDAEPPPPSDAACPHHRTHAHTHTHTHHVRVGCEPRAVRAQHRVKHTQPVLAYK